MSKVLILILDDNRYNDNSFRERLSSFSDLIQIVHEKEVMKKRGQYVFWRQIRDVPSLIECKLKSNSNVTIYHDLQKKAETEIEIMDYLFSLRLLE